MSQARGSAERREATTSDCFLAEVAQLRGFLWGQAMSLVRERFAADDLVQDTIVRALCNRHRFRGGTSLRAWTRSIMQNLFIDGWRRMPAWSAVDPAEIPAPPSSSVEDVGPLDVFGMDHVRVAARQLRRRDREIFTMGHLQRVPYRQIAVRFHMTVDTVGTRLFRIRQQIRKILERSLSESRGLPLPAIAPVRPDAGRAPKSRRLDDRIAPRAA